MEPRRKNLKWGIMFILFAVMSSASAVTVLKIRVEGNDFSDEVALRYIRGATSDYDFMYDALKLRSINPNAPTLATKIGENEYAINSLSPREMELPVELVFESSLSGEYTLSIIDTIGIPKGFTMMIIDSETGLSVDLLKSDYSFEYVGEIEGRFQVRMEEISSEMTISVSQPLCNEESGSVNFILPNEDLWLVRWKKDNQITSMMVSTQVVTSQLEEGNYLMEIFDKDLNLFHQEEILISGVDKMELLETIVTPKCDNDSSGEIEAIISGGVGPFNVEWSNGVQDLRNQGLGIGEYDLTIVDVNGCELKKSYSLEAGDVIDEEFSLISAPNIGDEGVLVELNYEGDVDSLLWMFGDGYVESSPSTVHEYQLNSVLTLYLKKGECSKTIEYPVIMDELLAVHEDMIAPMKVKRNGAIWSVELATNFENSGEAEFYDLSGRLIHKMSYQGKSFNFDSSISNGLVLFLVKDKIRNVSSKILQMD